MRELSYDSLKPEQTTAVESLLKGEDIYISVPTWFGKSLIHRHFPTTSFSWRYNSVLSAPSLSMILQAVVIFRQIDSGFTKRTINHLLYHHTLQHVF